MVLNPVRLISLAWVSSETHDLQRIFRRIYDTKGGVFVPGLPCGDRGNWD